MTISRLDERNISDPIIRAYMRQAIVAKCNSFDSDLIPHDISQDEIYRPDLISQRVWETDQLRWVITLVCGQEDESEPLPVGQALFLPTLAWIRELINSYSISKPELDSTIQSN
ncbi:baseplate protein [Pseudocitrobacter sp. RIT415]|uniref:baseplate protein n=1 Tax=Pseudocitrobacter sp. RIT415 TaxID=2202163 RepID=UPI001F35349A|nr:baseplate protein [Pseudocitrobacter sp. RIT 415]